MKVNAKERMCKLVSSGVILVARFFGMLAVFSAAFWAGFLPVHGQSDGTGTTLIGQIEDGNAVVYRLPDLLADDTFYAYVAGVSGNLDPVLYLLDGDADVLAVRDAAYSAARSADARGADAVTAFIDTIEGTILAWDDDSGQGYDAALALTLPKDGDYLIVVDANVFLPSSGEFQLLTGINAPEVLPSSGEFQLLTGINEPEVLNGQPPSNQLLTIEQEDELVQAVQVITATLTISQPARIHRLEQLQIGDTLEAIVEPSSGNLVPALVLEDFGGKALAVGNLQGTQEDAAIKHTFAEDPTGYRLRVRDAAPNSVATAGDYQLIVGLNTPEPLTTESVAQGPTILRAPIPVRVRLKIDQITDVDQLAENFGIVASLELHWHDPAVAFSPDSCRCDVKRFRSERVINDYIIKNDINIFPAWILFNQQASRSTQTKILAVESNGNVALFERFAATLQAPDFNFRQLPFDVQQFYVRVQALFESEYFTFFPDDADSGFGAQLGEEEWIFSQEEFTSETLIYADRTQVAFGFTTHRHLNFYIFRIFLPVLIIILISWFTFFLREYSRRIEVTSANLLLFIAYNFTIADDLPRIGYLTFTDVFLISTFVVSGVVIIINVWFRRLERAGRDEVAEKWDHILVWLYPLLYLIGGFVVYLIFFPPL